MALLGKSAIVWALALAGMICGGLAAVPASAQTGATWASTVERWGIEEVVLNSTRTYANPFKDVTLAGVFTSAGRTVKVDGFHDGGSTWKIRFMPDAEGEWSFRTVSNDPSLNNVRSKFRVGPPSPGNHGPVRIAKTYHFTHADGTPYFLLGTTSYNWLNRDEALQERSLATLRQEPFNKLRFGLFPKWFVFNRVDPERFPYASSGGGKTIDFERFDPVFFANVERRIRDLDALGIQADVILFHPYDNWGFAKMDAAHNEAYVRYVVARLGAFRNIWWTMANEYDLMDRPDWDKLGRLVRAGDPYGHPIGNHPIADWYDPHKPWIDRVILQGGQHLNRVISIARNRYRKPVVDDEYGYEGNNTMGWGDLKSDEAVSRHWEITMAGGYASHGDTFVHPAGIQFWAAGGEMEGESRSRLGFLKKVMSELPFQDMVPSPELVVGGTALALPGKAYLFRFVLGDVKLFEPLPQTQVRLAGVGPLKVELIDPWAMKIYDLGYTSAGDQVFTLLMKPSLLRITTAPSASGSPEPLSVLLGRFAGETLYPETPPVLDPALFRREALHYSSDFPIAQLELDPAAKAVLDKYLPPEARKGILRAFSVDFIVERKLIDEETRKRIDAELRQISVK